MKRWSEIALDFIQAAQGGVNLVIKQQRKKFLKKLIALAVIFLGAILLLSGIAGFLGEMLNGKNWSGYLLVGILLIISGFFVSKLKD